MNNDVEFFATNPTDIKAFNNGRRLTFEEFPEWIISRIELEIVNTGSHITSVQAFIYEYFRGLDNEPDLKADGTLNYSEYCEGSKTLLLPNGNHLTATELAVLKRIYKPNKIIADEMGISSETVNSHIQNIVRKTGLYGKLELSIYGTSKGIINANQLIK